MDDEKFIKECIEFTCTKETITASKLQIYFRIGYCKANRMIDLMAGEGIIAKPKEYYKPWVVLKNSQQAKVESTDTPLRQPCVKPSVCVCDAKGFAGIKLNGRCGWCDLPRE